MADYDPAWPEAFEAECTRLRAVLPARVPLEIEHFGSTAVPGLAAKPILDLLLVCEPEADWNALREPIESLGYLFWRDPDDADHWLFVKGMPPLGEGRSHHVHVRPPYAARRHLAFRDALRAEPELARRYAALKHRLAEAHRHDREAYTAAKGDFVREVLAARGEPTR